ncbi:MAG: retroviral-like aspartic protease family protein [Planctomycetota bacterium]
MQCPKCLSYNHNAAGFCDQCGAPMRTRRGAAAGGSGSGTRVVLAVVVGVVLGCVIVGGGYLLLRNQDRGAPAPVRDPGSEPREFENRPADVSFSDGDTIVAPVADLAEPDETAATVRMEGDTERVLQVAQVTISDAWSSRLAAVPAAVVAGSWVVLPRRACLGGTNWQAKLSSGQSIDIVDGYWRTGSRIGLWKLAVDEPVPGPELRPWDRNEKLTWLPYSGQSVDDVRVGFLTRHGDFSSFAPTQGLGRPGVIVQGSAVVGWTFGEHEPGEVWLWEGLFGEDLVTGTRVMDFFNLTFAGGREEWFARTMAENGALSALDRIDAFTQGCHVLPRLLAEETPQLYRATAVTVKVKQLLSPIVHAGDAAQLNWCATRFDDTVLLEAADPQLLVVMATAVAESLGAAQGIGLLQRVGPEITDAGSIDERLQRELELQLYRQWVRELVAAESVATGWNVLQQAQQAFPGDAELHLRGVELALLEGDWATAEQLLRSRSYPAVHADLVKILSSQVSQLKGQEGKVVIRFRPGSNSIRTVAQLNGRYDQDFIVDTGASSTLVPASTIRSMGLRIPSSAPRVRVQTANGRVTVPQMRLDSIVIGGYPVRDIDVLVMDMPGQEGVGLLGLNTLDHFRMDLNLEDGILTLEPR